MALTELKLGDTVKHKSSNGMVDQMTVKKIQTKGMHGQTESNPCYLCSYFSTKTKELEIESFERHELEFISRPEEK